MTIRHTNNGHFPTGAQNLTTQHLTLGAPQTVTPEFVGYQDAKVMFGISRTHLYHLGMKGLVDTYSLRGLGKTRGRRLYSVESIRALIKKSIG